MSLAIKIDDLLESCRNYISDIKPSEWAEKNRVMDSSETPFPGPFRYDKTPYSREIVDCMAPDHPARVIAVMKAAQIGFSVGAIEPAIGWSIAENPCNILFLTGHTDLSEEAMAKIDKVIDNSGIRHLIKPQTFRARSQKTGDTNMKKEYAGGSLIAGSATNHKLMRQRSIHTIFVDDFEAAKQASKESGSTLKLIQQRQAAYASKGKLYLISTPEIMETSNIYPAYMAGDQRKFMVPCPCCGEFINYEWQTTVEKTEKPAGITWKTTEEGKLIPESVGYTCQKCGEFFDESDKYERNLLGYWKPTAEPERPGNYSYHISALYAPPGMFSWEHYIRDYMEANPPGQPEVEAKMKTFTNLCLGLPFEPKGDTPSGTALQQNNVRPYKIGIVPEKLSIKDGNGMVMMLTCAADLNGKEDDARLDYEILAHTETGSTYSITHGSIGTFILNEGQYRVREDRKHWTYRHGQDNSVWTEFDKVLAKVYEFDTGIKARVMITGIDAGHLQHYVYEQIEKRQYNQIALRGSPMASFIKIGSDKKWWKLSQERANLYLLESNAIKDELAQLALLRFDERADSQQPAGYMNYPMPENGLYGYNNYFSHYEAEHKVYEVKDGMTTAWTWKKKGNGLENHLFDVRCYNIALREIFSTKFLRAMPQEKDYSWGRFCEYIKAARKK